MLWFLFHFIPIEQHPKFRMLVDLWHKDGRLVEMKIYDLLGGHPRIVAYPCHDPVTFELLQHPKGIHTVLVGASQ